MAELSDIDNIRTTLFCYRIERSEMLRHIPAVLNLLSSSGSVRLQRSHQVHHLFAFFLLIEEFYEVVGSFLFGGTGAHN